MLLLHNTLSLVLLIFVTTHHATGVKINLVELKSGMPFVNRLSPAHITFNLTMEPEEKLQSVVWQRADGTGRYEWLATGTVIVSGTFVRAIDISAENAELLFPRVLLDHRGDYNLTVFTNNGDDTATYNLIVHPNCTWPVKTVASQFAPYPNISTVFEDDILGITIRTLEEFVEVERNVTDHHNGTFHFEVAPVIPIQQVPINSWISWQYTVEETSVPIFKTQTSLTATPCPEPPTKANLTFNFISLRPESCYGGYIQGAMISYFCTENQNLAPHKILRCGSEGRWTEIDNTPWPECNITEDPDGNNGNSGVKINLIELRSRRPFVYRLSPAHITFHLTMEPEEKLQSVVWQRADGTGHYEWLANGTVIVSGTFVEAIDISAINGELLFPRALLDHRGDYNLTVFTSNGKDTATYKLIVHQFSSLTFSFPLYTSNNCTWPVKMVVSQFAPYPNISAVFEDDILGTTIRTLEEIVEVKRNVTDHNNGTFHFEVAPVIPIQKFPIDSWMSWQFTIEETSVSILRFRSSLTAKPCPEPPTKANLTFNFISWMPQSCHGGYLQGAMISYFCTEHPDLAPRKILQCGSEGRWTEIDNTPWPECNIPAEITEDPKGNNGNSGTFHRLLLTTSFLIASYYAVK